MRSAEGSPEINPCGNYEGNIEGNRAGIWGFPADHGGTSIAGWLSGKSESKIDEGLRGTPMTQETPKY